MNGYYHIFLSYRIIRNTAVIYKHDISNHITIIDIQITQSTALPNGQINKDLIILNSTCNVIGCGY